MLYNILPPLIFFTSFAGIIVLVSRVAMRFRRQEFSHAMRVEAQSPVSQLPEQFLHPERSSINLIKNRVGAVAANVRESVTGAKSFLQKRRERKAQEAEVVTMEPEAQAEEVPAEEVSRSTAASISIPTSSWREKTTSFFQRSSQRMQEGISNIRQRAEKTIQEAKTTPVPLREMTSSSETVATKSVASAKEKVSSHTSPIRIIRVETPQVKSETSTPVAEPKSSPEGRFIARFKKPEKKKPTILQSANDAIEAGQYNQAEEMLVSYIVEHTRDCDAYMLLGKVAIAKNAWQEAMEVFQQIVHLRPEMSDAQAGLGYAALQQGKFSIALQALQRAHEADPQNKKILEQLLHIAKRLDNKVLQKSVLEQIIELDPDNATATQALLQVNSRTKTRA